MGDIRLCLCTNENGDKKGHMKIQADSWEVNQRRKILDKVKREGNPEYIFGIGLQLPLRQQENDLQAQGRYVELVKGRWESIPLTASIFLVKYEIENQLKE